MRIKIEIPMQPYLHKFLTEELGADYTLTKKDSISRVLFHSVGNSTGGARHIKKEGEVYFIVRVGSDYLYRNNKVGISVEAMKDFLDYADGLFRRLMLQFIWSRVVLKSNIDFASIGKNHFAVHQAINDFLEQYDIKESEFKLETAKKWFQRHVNWKKKNKNKLLPLEVVR